jgi:hypothetical protein
MTKKLNASLAAVVCILVFSGAIFAHHGGAGYDTKTVLTLKGVVTDFEFVNPHSQIYFDVKNDKGETENWGAEITAPSKLARAGWTKHTLKPGDEIIVTGNPAKNAAHTLSIRKLIGPDGQALPLSENQGQE